MLITDCRCLCWLDQSVNQGLGSFVGQWDELEIRTGSLIPAHVARDVWTAARSERTFIEKAAKMECCEPHVFHWQGACRREPICRESETLVWEGWAMTRDDGDERLIDLQGIQTWHFPYRCEERGRMNLKEPVHSIMIEKRDDCITSKMQRSIGDWKTWRGLGKRDLNQARNSKHLKTREKGQRLEPSHWISVNFIILQMSDCKICRLGIVQNRDSSLRRWPHGIDERIFLNFIHRHRWVWASAATVGINQKISWRWFWNSSQLVIVCHSNTWLAFQAIIPLSCRVDLETKRRSRRPERRR
jgi:hypothetical protein